MIDEYVSGVISLHQDDLRPSPPLQWSFYMPTYGPPVPGDWGSVEIDVKEEVRKYRARQKFAWDTDPAEQVSSISDLSALEESSSSPTNPEPDSEASGDIEGRGFNIEIPDSSGWWKADPPARDAAADAVSWGGGGVQGSVTTHRRPQPSTPVTFQRRPLGSTPGANKALSTTAAHHRRVPAPHTPLTTLRPPTPLTTLPRRPTAAAVQMRRQEEGVEGGERREWSGAEEDGARATQSARVSGTRTGLQEGTTPAVARQGRWGVGQQLLHPRQQQQAKGFRV